MSQINLLCAEAPLVQCVLAAFRIEINYFWIMFHYGCSVAPDTSGPGVLNAPEGHQIVWWWTGSERAGRWICPGPVADLALCVNHRTKRASDQHHSDPATNHSTRPQGDVSHKALLLPRRSRTIRSAGLSGRSFIIAVTQHTSAFNKGVDSAALCDICQSVTC